MNVNVHPVVRARQVRYGEHAAVPAYHESTARHRSA